jgi:hypothetical protein
MTEEILQKSDEWIMVGTHEPQNFYLGRLVYPLYPKSPMTCPPDTHSDFVDLVQRLMKAGEPLHLTEARFLLTMLQMAQQGGINMITQLTPISGSSCGIDLYIRANVVIFPTEVPGLAQRLDEMTVHAADREQHARASAAGIVLGAPLPNPSFPRKS